LKLNPCISFQDSSETSSSSGNSEDSFGSLGELIDVDVLSDGPVPVVLLTDNDDEPMDWND
jgi:hypothetical protein